jgi:hypothetical protein
MPSTDTDTFHDELVAPGTADLPERFFDRFVFNLHRVDKTAPSILFGFGIYPPKDTADGFAILVTETEQRNVRFSTELSGTDWRTAGPFSYDVLEPMKAWRLKLAPNPTGLEFDLTWRARAPAWHGELGVVEGDKVTAKFDHLFQSGCYDGTLTIDGETQQIEGWYGQRDRSRGVRTMTGGQGIHIWYQAQFEDRSVGFVYVEDRRHSQLLLEGAVMQVDGVVDTIVDVGHDLVFDENLDLVEGRVEVRTERGETYVIDADARAGGGYMSGGGYGGHHGKPLGRDHVEHDVYPLDGSVNPRTVDTSLTDRLASFDWEGNPGSGIFEFALTRSSSYAYKPKQL